MGATEEQMQLLSAADVTHVSYILILYSVAFLLYLFVNILLYVYASWAWPDDESNGLHRGGASSSSSSQSSLHARNVSVAGPAAGPSGGVGHGRKVSVMPEPGMMNGSAGKVARLPKHRGTDSQQVRDAEEFELEGLISDEGEGDMGESPVVGKKEGGVQLA